MRYDHVFDFFSEHCDTLGVVVEELRRFLSIDISDPGFDIEQRDVIYAISPNELFSFLEKAYRQLASFHIPMRSCDPGLFLHRCVHDCFDEYDGKGAQSPRATLWDKKGDDCPPLFDIYDPFRGKGAAIILCRSAYILPYLRRNYGPKECGKNDEGIDRGKLNWIVPQWASFHNEPWEG